MTETPLVSVYMTTYYHEKYIAEALDSILRQRISFPYEIVISDDCSQDGTVGIIRQYAEKHDCIRLHVNEQNLGLTANMFQVRTFCRGKYLVDLSGDDYWIDDDKLRKQVDFLESHPDYLGVCTCVESRADGSDTAGKVYPDKKLVGREFTLDMFLKGANCPLNGMMMRNVLLSEEGYRFFSLMPKISRYVDDLTDELLLHLYGRLYVLPDVTVAYRVRLATKEDRNYNTLNRGVRMIRNHIELLNNLHRELGDRVDLFGRYRLIMKDLELYYLRGIKRAELREIYRSIPAELRRRGLAFSTALSMPGYVAYKLRDRIAGR